MWDSYPGFRASETAMIGHQVYRVAQYRDNELYVDASYINTSDEVIFRDKKYRISIMSTMSAGLGKNYVRLNLHLVKDEEPLHFA